MMLFLEIGFKIVVNLTFDPKQAFEIWQVKQLTRSKWSRSPLILI